MKFTFENLKSQSKQLFDNKLFALIVGIRGSGKSSVLGTLGMKTFLITSTLESHSLTAAKAMGGNNIIPFLYDVDDAQKQLKPDAAIEKLHDILSFLLESPDVLTHVQAIALDSIGAIDKTLLETTRIITEKNNWAVIDIMETEHLRIIRKLKELHRKGLHILVTMPIIATFDEDGLYTTAAPEIRGIKTSSVISGVFPDILPITKYHGQFVFQMDMTMKKVSVDKQGKEKVFIAHPRINGVLQDEIKEASPELLLAADLSYINEFKQRKHTML